MTTATKDAGRFLTSASTTWVTLVRLGLILLPRLASSISSMKWFYSPSFLSVIIRPHQTLSQIIEAHAVRALASDRAPTDFSSFYNANDAVRTPPIVLAIFSKFIKMPNFELWLSLFLLVVDILISYFLEQIGIGLLALAFSSQSSNAGETSSQSKHEQSKKEGESQTELLERVRPEFAHIFPTNSSTTDDQPLISLKSLPLLSAQLYYWSPFTALPSSLLYCWQNIAPLFLVASIYESICSSSSGGSLSVAAFYLAVATYIEPQHIVLIAPIILISSFHSSAGTSKCDSKTTKAAVFVVLSFITWSLLLHGASCSLVGLENYWRILGTVYGNTWLTTSPNLSLQWYFRMQMFSRFRDYFGAIFAAIPFTVVGPLCLRFFRYPWVLIASFSMIAAIYRPVQVLYDANFALCFFLFCPRSLARMGYAAFIALCCLWVPLILNVVDNWMWLEANNGNANYMFFQCLAYNVFLGIVLGQFVSASVQHDKALRLEQEIKAAE